MADILSQDEVDALLGAVTDEEETTSTLDSSGAVVNENDGEVNKYDFRRPDIVSKDQLRTLQMLHKTFCRYLTTNLSTYLRTIVEVNLVAVDQLTYGEFNMSLSNPTWINVFSMKPLEGRSILEVNPILVYTMIDRLLGGPGDPPPEIKPLTDIEQSIIARVIDIMLTGLHDAWSNILDFDIRIEEQEVNPQFVQIVAPGETVILISCEMKIGSTSGIVSICLPFIYFEPIMSSLSAQHWISATQKKPTDDMKKAINHNLGRTSLEVKALLGDTQVNVRQLLGLKTGDVVVLDQKANEPILVEVGRKKSFQGSPGIYGKKKGVQIVANIGGKKK
jgi:flagellar motor switch protein FliM